MFENKSIFLIVKDGKEEVIYKLETDNNTQKDINEVFENSSNEFIKKRRVVFDGCYTPLEDEVLCILDFNIPNKLKEAFRNPITIDSFVANKENIQNIRTVCIGYCDNTDGEERFVASFQCFRKDQYISTDKLNLFFDNNTLKKCNSVGIAIGAHVDCVLVGTELFFNSYYFAQQVFDLKQYYRTATKDDINSFLRCEIIDFDVGKDKFMSKVNNNWVRRKIARINDSGVLSNHNAIDIKRKAKKHSGLDIIVKDKKIVFPEDFEEVKVFLSFLDEESWIGPFSNDTFVSTSKRKIKDN